MLVSASRIPRHTLSEVPERRRSPSTPAPPPSPGDLPPPSRSPLLIPGARAQASSGHRAHCAAGKVSATNWVWVETNATPERFWTPLKQHTRSLATVHKQGANRAGPAGSESAGVAPLGGSLTRPWTRTGGGGCVLKHICHTERLQHRVCHRGGRRGAGIAATATAARPQAARARASPREATLRRCQAHRRHKRVSRPPLFHGGGDGRIRARVNHESGNLNVPLGTTLSHKDRLIKGDTRRLHRQEKLYKQGS